MTGRAETTTMRNLLAGAVAAAVVCAGSTASALTFGTGNTATPPPTFTGGSFLTPSVAIPTVPASGTPSGTGIGTISVEWSQIPAGDTIGAYVDFDAADDFELFLDAYAAGADDASGLILWTLDSLGGSTTGRLTTTDTTFCATSLVAGGFDLAGDCDLIGTASGATAPSVNPLSIGGTTTLTAGAYRLGFYDDDVDAAGSVDFTVREVSAIPLPAAGLLLAGLMGGLAWRSRRRARAA